MIITDYDLGSLVRVEIVFRDANRVATDPVTVALKTWSPVSKTVTSLDYPANVVKDDTGQYHYDVTADEVGTWLFEWNGDGFLEQGAFNVVPTVFS